MRMYLLAILETVRVIGEKNMPHPDMEVLFPVAEEKNALLVLELVTDK